MSLPLSRLKLSRSLIVLARWHYMLILPDLFSRRFREGISFPNFVERSILKLPLSKLCAVPFAIQNRALFEGEKGAKRCQKRGGIGVASKGGKERVKTGRLPYHVQAHHATHVQTHHTTGT